VVILVANGTLCESSSIEGPADLFEASSHSYALFLIITLSLLMSYIYGATSKARNLKSYIYGRDFLLGILLLEPCI
jgi:hypothetical protein